MIPDTIMVRTPGVRALGDGDRHMRGTAGRAGTAGLVIGVLVTGLGACTGEADRGGDGKAEACAEGTYTWSAVRREQRLTALSDPIRFEKRTGTYTSHLKAVGDTVYRPSVTGAPEGAGAAGVITALGRHLKVGKPLAGPSDTERPAHDHFFESRNGAYEGAYYAFAAIDLVEADFTYTCGERKPAKGHVRTWEGAGAGFLSCSTPSDETAGQIAAQRTCPAGSEAAQAS
ncbi:hypothetical protein [Streptomyces sp. NPDC046832]|uniref:hypothetical protein n=1 Tax=Streptomyces sp. NPDC046832 TaxID=3155020 RepID=UPI0033F76C50